MAVLSVSTVVKASDRWVTRGAKTRASCWIKRRYPAARLPVLELQYPGESAASRSSFCFWKSTGRVRGRVQQWQRRKRSSFIRRHRNWENGKDSGFSSGILKRTNSWVALEPAGVSDLCLALLWCYSYRFALFFFACWKLYDAARKCRNHRR